MPTSAHHSKHANKSGCRTISLSACACRILLTFCCCAVHARALLTVGSSPSPATQAELTAGLYNTGSRNGYLPMCQVLARHKACLVLTGGEMRDCEQPSHALASPESLLLQLKATAASQRVPVILGNLAPRFDAEGLGELERKAFDAACYRGIDVGHVDGLVFSSMADAMFEPHNWHAFKEWAGRLRQHNDALRFPPRRGAAAAAAQRQLQQQQQQQSTAAARQPALGSEPVPASEERQEAMVA